MGILLFHEEQVRVDTKADSCAKLVQPNSDILGNENTLLDAYFSILKKSPPYHIVPFSIKSREEHICSHQHDFCMLLNEKLLVLHLNP